MVKFNTALNLLVSIVAVGTVVEARPWASSDGGVPGGKMYQDYCIPGCNDWSGKTSSKKACYEKCKKDKKCKTADWYKNKCYIQSCDIKSAKDYPKCDMWVKNPVGSTGNFPGKGTITKPTPRPTPVPATPKPTEAPVPGPAPAGSSGDPHFRTWTGENYDFHGECDLVLMENPDFSNGLGLYVHIRTKIHATWSSIQSAAVRLGENTLEIAGDAGDNKISYWLNGEKVSDMQTGDASLGDYSVHFRRITNLASQTRIDLGHGNAVSVETFKHFVRVNMKTKEPKHFSGSYGMLGSNPDGRKVGRDKVTVFEDPNDFGQEWQVTETDHKLFHSVDGVVQHPQKCLMPNKALQTEERRRLGESAIAEEAAVLACARVPEHDRDACVFDVLATNDLEMVGSY